MGDSIYSEAFDDAMKQSVQRTEEAVKALVAQLTAEGEAPAAIAGVLLTSGIAMGYEVVGENFQIVVNGAVQRFNPSLRRLH